jgi:hypothetical protein
MLVYGDPRKHDWLGRAFGRFRARAAATDFESIDELRDLLVEAGELEQAAADCPRLDSRFQKQIARLTDSVAAGFLQRWLNHDIAENLSAEISGLVNEINSTAVDAPITLKLPEGFAFYALFPEQYCVAATAWAADHAAVRPRRAIIAGLRSIGTTLSAAVAATLKSLGWEVHRFTIRPEGHPHDRRVVLPRFDFPRPDCALIVDEGPGLSGSSMAAAARALAGAGITDISFLPGHDGEPGAAATAEIRQWWRATPRYTTALAELKWNGRSLGESLVAEARRLRHAGGTFDTIEDLGGGQWRRAAFASAAEWPAVAASFERLKFRAVNREGGSVLWKFCGLGGSASAALRKLSAPADAGLVPRPLGCFRGFLALPWIEGRRLVRADADAAVLNHIGRYLLRVAGPPLADDESREAIERLTEMVLVNVTELLGKTAAEQTHACLEALRHPDISFSYGDGHLAPHEWVRTDAGELLKTDSFGHDEDHTWIGPQSLLWDIAGALVEWDLNLNTAAPLLAPIRAAGVPIDPAALAFYELAYSAFRAGLFSLAVQSNDADEQHRARHAVDFYRNRLARVLKRETSATLYR